MKKATIIENAVLNKKNLIRTIVLIQMNSIHMMSSIHMMVSNMMILMQN